MEPEAPADDEAAAAEGSGAASEDEIRTEFIAAIRAKRQAGKKVLLSIGGANGQNYIANASGNYTVTQTVSGCESRTTPFSVPASTRSVDACACLAAFTRHSLQMK